MQCFSTVQRTSVCRVQLMHKVLHTVYSVQFKKYSDSLECIGSIIPAGGGECWKYIKQLWCIGETFSRQCTAKCQKLNLVFHCCQWLSRTLNCCSLYEAVQRCSLLQYFRVYSVHCTIQCKLICILQSTLYSTVYTLLYPTLYTILYLLYSIHFIVPYTVHYTVLTVQCTLYWTLHCTLYCTYCTVYTTLQVHRSCRVV